MDVIWLARSNMILESCEFVPRSGVPTETIHSLQIIFFLLTFDTLLH